MCFFLFFFCWDILYIAHSEVRGICFFKHVLVVEGHAVPLGLWPGLHGHTRFESWLVLHGISVSGPYVPCLDVQTVLVPRGMYLLPLLVFMRVLYFMFYPFSFTGCSKNLDYQISCFINILHNL